MELRRQGKTVILSTHIFSLVEKLCDRVGIIVNGRMAVCDTLSALTASDDLEDVFFDIIRKLQVMIVGKGIWTIMKKELARFFKDGRMCLTTLLLRAS